MKPSDKVAVIDVGSNSCRLVIYERSGVALLPYFNEKTMAGLGRDLAETGVLYPNGRRKALETLKRFGAILEGLGIDDISVVATAAVREAADGAEFCEQAQAVLGVPVQVLSGQDEGRLSAGGVAYGFPRQSGLVADLGGSSVEFETLRGKSGDGPGETFLLGPLARQADQDMTIEARRAAIQSVLASSQLLLDQPARIFAVGGAWRTVAAVHMMLTGYPLKVVNGYRLGTKALSQLIDAIERSQSDKALRERLQKVAKKRFDTLLHAVLVLQGILKAANAKSATISAYGLRDGVVADKLRPLDPRTVIKDASNLFFNLTPNSESFGSALFEFVLPLFGMHHADEALIQSTCDIGDAGARLHPDHRPYMIFQQIARAPLPGMDHRARLFSAYAVASRYTFRFDIPEGLAGLLDEEDRKMARILGTAMRLGGAFSGRSASILTTAKIARSDTNLCLKVWQQNEDMISGTVKRRLKQLSGLLDLEPEIQILDRL